MHGVVFDLPGVIDGARTRVGETGLTDRCELIAGDFFEAVPAGGDAYVLSWILNDWDDQAAARILANCRAAIREGGRLLVIELVNPSAEEAPASPDLDRLVKAADPECRHREPRVLVRAAANVTTGRLRRFGVAQAGVVA